MSANGKLISDIEALLAAAKSYNVDQPDPLAQLDLLGRVEALHQQLDDPKLAMYRQLTNFAQTAAVRSILQIGALKKIPRDGSISAKELASSIGADEQVVRRLMRTLSATGIVESVSENVYAHTRFSLAYIDGSEVQFFELVIDQIAPVAARIPEYLATHPPSSILDPKQTPFSWASGQEGKDFYEVLVENPARLAQFGKGMMTQEAQQRILGIYPFAALAKDIDLSDPERAFIVDVAGGRGQSLVAIKGEIEAGGKVELGKWILQEKKAVIDSIPDNELPGIEKMAIDFFDPQPVKNAHIYHLRRILHNWGDNEALKILKNIAEAMLPDSKLLIGEMIVPEKPGVNKYVYMLDMCMLVIGGKERSEMDFSNLLDSAGLKLVKVWISKVGNQTMIESRLK